MDLVYIFLIPIAVLIITFFGGFYTHHKWQRKLDLGCLAQARKELGENKRDAEFDFFPGTMQYRPIVSGYTTHAIDKVFVWSNDSEIGICGAETRSDNYKIDEFPLIFNVEDMEGEPLVALGNYISKFGQQLIDKREAASE